MSYHRPESQIVLAVEVEELVRGGAAARWHHRVVPQVGDFVAADEPLFNLYGGAARIDDADLRATVAFGTERTMEQDPTFAFRILVDIALKALSPAINDPTTAVLAMDQLHRLLRVVGAGICTARRSATRPATCVSSSARPNWEDFVHVACTEIRSLRRRQHPDPAPACARCSRT